MSDLIAMVNRGRGLIRREKSRFEEVCTCACRICFLEEGGMINAAGSRKVFPQR